MTLLFAGGEDVDFTATGTLSISTTGTPYRSTFARCGLSLLAPTTAVDPPSPRITPVSTFTGGAQSSFWLTVQCNNGSNGIPVVNYAWIRFLDGANARLMLRTTGVAIGQFKLSKRTAAGAFTDLATCTTNFAAGLSKIDIQVNYAVSGLVNVYIAGVLALTYSGDVTTDSATTLNSFDLATISNSTTSTIFSEIVVKTTDTRSTSLTTLPPLAAGNTQAWLPNTLANINKTTINDATLISTTAVNTLSQWTTNTTLPTGTWNIDAIVQAARMETATGAPQNAEWSCRTIDGTNHVMGAIAPTTGGFTNFGNAQWLLNPHTGVAWVAADLATGFNLGVESLT